MVYGNNRYLVDEWWCRPVDIFQWTKAGLFFPLLLAHPRDHSNNRLSVNRIEAEKEFIILPKSREEPILGIKTIRDLDLVGKYPRLFRTEAAMARQSPPIVSAGDKVTTQKKPGEGKNKRKKNAHPESPWKNVKDSQGFHLGVPVLLPVNS